MPCPLLIFSQSDYWIQIVAINLHSWWQTVQIQISWLLKKPTDLDLHCLQNRVYPGSAGQGLKLYMMWKGQNDQIIMIIDSVLTRGREGHDLTIQMHKLIWALIAPIYKKGSFHILHIIYFDVFVHLNALEKLPFCFKFCMHLPLSEQQILQLG